MKALYDLKELYFKELEKIARKGDLTPVDAEAAKIALEGIEKIEEVCEMYEEEEEYSEAMYPRRSMRRSYARGPRSYGMPEMSRGYSERRGRSNATGRYISRNNESTVDHMISSLEDMKSQAPDNDTRIAIDNLINKLEAY